jgi:CRISPR-associated endonuclease Csn1
MNWRLGLDLGTNSIGWAVLVLNEKDEVLTLENMGSRIFSDGRNPKTGEPLGVQRRTARGIRRNLQRRKQRRKKLFRLLQKEGLFPLKVEEAQALKQADPYVLRVKALDEKLEAQKLGRALFHLGVRRGFKSNRKDAPDERLDEDAETSLDKLEEKEKTKLKQGEKVRLFQGELERSGARTLGEYLYKKKSGQDTQVQRIRFAPDSNSYYPVRQMYEDEFAKIRAVQGIFYPDIDWEAIHHAIFDQRPLRSQERGKCQFDFKKDRTFKAMPCSHKFRILQEVFNLNYVDALTYRTVVLSDEQQDRLISALNNKKELSFSGIRKLLKIDGTFNLETMSRDRLNGNVTAFEMRKDKYFGKLWDTLPLSEQDEIVENLIIADEDEEVIPLLAKYPLSDEQKTAVLHMRFPSGIASFCKEITEALVAKMEEARLQYHKAAEALGYAHSDQSVEKYDTLPYYGKVLVGSTLGAGRSNDENQPEKKYGKIANPTVHVALNQTRAVVNALIKKYGKPSQIIVEVSRELKASREEKGKIQQRQTEKQKRNAILDQEIKDACPAIKFPNRTDRRKWRLWEELGENVMSRHCPYCGTIINEAEMFNDDIIEIDHILPFSRTLLDAESNLTVAHRRCNNDKKNYSPWEAFHTNPGNYNWDDIVARASLFKNPVKRRRFTEEAMEEFEKDSSFIARQLSDNAYLSKIALQYLKTLCNDNSIWATSGGMTKILRDKWEIDSILKRRITDKEAADFNLDSKLIGEFKKNRFDHRHHALDAMVIGLCDRSMVQNIATMCADSLKNYIKPPPLPFSYSDIVKKVQNIVVSFKPDHGVGGKLSKETALGRVMCEEEINIAELKPEDIRHIKDRQCRTAFENGMAAGSELKSLIKQLTTTYPKLRVFRLCFVSRMPLTSLKDIKNINDIVDTEIQKKLNAFIIKYPDEKFDKVLVEFSRESGIKRVRCKTFAQSPIIIEPRKNNPLSVVRYYNPEDYFTAIIWEIPPAKDGKKPTYQAQYVRRTETDKDGIPIADKPHPAARKVCILFKDDYVEFAKGGEWKKARIAGYSATNNNIDIRPIYASKDIESWVKSTSDQMLEEGWKLISGQNYISVNVLFGERSARKITVSPIGEVNRNPKK